MAKASSIFVNLPVKSLKRSVKFWRALGFRFNKEFTGKNATCLMLGRNLHAMLLVEKFFKSFNRKLGICNTDKGIEAITALQLKSRGEVDALTGRAIKAGARKTREAYDHGWMYGNSIRDLDGHIWEFFFMDVAAMRKAQKNKE
ncbi:MAG: VOC family protein [Candidatus Micrarchaeia archaeon]|jgi:hypothetical protein